MTFCPELTLTRHTAYTALIALILCICRTGVADFPNQQTNFFDDYDFDVDVSDREAPLPRVIHDNGMLHLVLHYLSLKLIREMESEEETRLNKRQSQMLHDKITGFYQEILKHPALNNDRVAFSQMKPDFAKFQPDYPREASLSSRRGKRSTSGYLTEICPSVRGWERKSEGRTRTRDEVILYPDQHFYTTTCLFSGQSCNHIDESTTRSECTSRSSWTIAYVSHPSSVGYEWEWIAIDTCCSCAASS